MSYGTAPALPSLRMDDYNHTNIVDYLSAKHARNRDIGFGVCQYANGLSTLPSANAYYGGVYSPIQNRIYMMPYTQALQSLWHYIDCSTGEVVSYTHGLGTLPVTNAYRGGVLSPGNNRIYMVPRGQASQSLWHYIDGNTGAVVSYAHGLSTLPVSAAYTGGVYSPTQNRIYLIPDFQATSTEWHYIDCATGAVVPYTHGATVVTQAYAGGVYSPVQNRIYLAPHGQANQTVWHYIDCNNGVVVPYAHGLGTLPQMYGYIGGAYAPSSNRIYLSPYAQANQTVWHYIDCDNGTVVQYAHGLVTPLASGAYLYLTYSPASDKLFLGPQTQGAESTWHYIDAKGGTVRPYTHGVSAVSGAYRGAVYSPTNNRLYFMPIGQANQASWHYIQEYSASDVSPTLMSSTLFNKL